MFKKLLQKRHGGKKNDGIVEPSYLDGLGSSSLTEKLMEDQNEDLTAASPVSDNSPFEVDETDTPLPVGMPTFLSDNDSSYNSQRQVDAGNVMHSLKMADYTYGSLDKSYEHPVNSTLDGIATDFAAHTNEPAKTQIDGRHKVYGLQNFGNTCYCNSVLQCLYNITEFRHSVLGEEIASTLLSRNESMITLDDYEATQEYDPVSNPKKLKTVRTLKNSSNLHPDIESTNHFQDANDTVEDSFLEKIDNVELEGSSDREQLSVGFRNNNVIVGRSLNKSVNVSIENLSRNDTTGVSLDEYNMSKINADDTTAVNDSVANTYEQRKRDALSHGPVVEPVYGAETNNTNLFVGLQDIFKAIHTSSTLTGVVSPTGFIDVLKKSNILFDTDMHQDAHEFLNFLLNDLSDNVTKYDVNTINSDEINFIDKMFKGTLTNQVRCLICDSITSRNESYLDFPVEVVDDESIDLQKTLNSYYQREMMHGSNKFYCDNCCELQEAERTLGLKELPHIMVIHLKRFKYSEKYNSNVKLFNKITYPLELNVCSTFNDQISKAYTLIGAIIHIGNGPQHGHYVSVCKTKKYGWLLYDDETVESIDEKTVLSYVGSSNSISTAYVLFYKESNLTKLDELNVNEQQENIKNLIQNDDYVRTTLRAEPVIETPIVTASVEEGKEDIISELKAFKKLSMKKPKLFNFKKT